MNQLNFVLLYVANPARSAAFYGELLGRQPVEQSDTFVMLPGTTGDAMLGLWKRSDIQPPAGDATGGSEFAFACASAAAVDACHDDWSRKGLRIAQPPTTMDFGRTFVALDPDGHRLRVYAPA